jgi:low affinity Fe/Cu permease
MGYPLPTVIPLTRLAEFWVHGSVFAQRMRVVSPVGLVVAVRSAIRGIRGQLTASAEREMRMTAVDSTDRGPDSDTRDRAGLMPAAAGASRLSPFDRFATAASMVVSRAWFFIACVVLVVVWAPTFLVVPLDTWQLIINTVTTIITFLLVALLQNTQKRSDDAVQQKLNAMAEALSDLMYRLSPNDAALRTDEQELRNAVGLEQREGSQ